jgi:hypothetical protein
MTTPSELPTITASNGTKLQVEVRSTVFSASSNTWGIGSNYPTVIELQHNGEHNGRLLLDLGETYNLAQVFIDGQLVETLWKAPFMTDITDYVKGRNSIELEIKVTNLWVNNLIGDARKAPSERGSYVSFDFYDGTEPLQKSGLIGPVSFLEEL